MNNIEFVVGDWSRDGHERTDTYVYTSNKTVEEINKIYENIVPGAKEIIEYFDDFEPGPYSFENLADMPLWIKDFFEFDPNEDYKNSLCGIDIWPESMCDFIVEALKNVDPTLTLDLFETKRVGFHFGYGLYS